MGNNGTAMMLTNSPSSPPVIIPEDFSSSSANIESSESSYRSESFIHVDDFLTNQRGERDSGYWDDGITTTAFSPNEMLSEPLKDTVIFRDSTPPLMHGFLGGYVAGVASIILPFIFFALVVYILRKRRRRDAAAPDVKSVSALQSGVYQEYKHGQKELEGAAPAKGDDGQRYQELTVKHNKSNPEAVAKKGAQVSSDNEYALIDPKSDNQPTYLNVIPGLPKYGMQSSLV